METLSKLLLTLTIITSAPIISQGLKCFNCADLNYPKTCTAVQCSSGEICAYLRTGCIKLPFDFVNSCRELVVEDGLRTRACYCNTDLCNGEVYPNNALTRAAGEGTKPGLKCYDCGLEDCNNKKLREVQCSKGFNSCSTSVIEDETLGLPLLYKYCSSGLETGCVTSGANSLCVCKGNLCNGYGTTTFELLQPRVGKGTAVMKALKVLHGEVKAKQLYWPNVPNFRLGMFHPLNEYTMFRLRFYKANKKTTFRLRLFYPANENTNNLSMPTGVSLKLLVVLCTVCLIGCFSVCACVAVYRKFIKEGSTSCSKPDITFTSLPQA